MSGDEALYRQYLSGDDTGLEALMKQYGDPAGEPDFWGTNPLSHGLRRASSPERGSLFICPKQASCG